MMASPVSLLLHPSTSHNLTPQLRPHSSPVHPTSQPCFTRFLKRRRLPLFQLGIGRTWLCACIFENSSYFFGFSRIWLHLSGSPTALHSLLHVATRLQVYKVVDLIKAKGGNVTREPGPVKGGKSVIAFVEDPDGYKFELIQRGPTPEPLCQVMLRVGDLERSTNFYEKAFGMELLRTRDNPDYKYTIAIMGYGPEEKTVVLELTYNYGVKEYDKGNGYAQIAIGTDDVYKTSEVIQLAGGKITRQPGPLPGINTKIAACLDPDGWKSVFVDNADFLKELE